MIENKSGKNIYIIVGLLVIGVMLLIVMLAMSSQTSNNDAKELPKVTKTSKTLKVSQTTESTEKVANTKIKEFTLEAGAYYYKPNIIRVKEGDNVKITINSVDMMHNINIDELSVKSATAKAGESATVSFIASKKGTFEFYCSIGQHRAKGQIGSLIVE